MCGSAKLRDIPGVTLCDSCADGLYFARAPYRNGLCRDCWEYYFVELPLKLKMSGKEDAMTDQQLRNECLRRYAYDPDTGKLTNLYAYNNSVKPGQEAGTLESGYRMVGINRKQYPAHRLIWLMTYGQMPTRKVTHKNGKRDDNRLSNLRIVDIGTRFRPKKRRVLHRMRPKPKVKVKEGNASSQKRNKSKENLVAKRSKQFIGVLQRDGVWIAHIALHGQERVIGRYNNALDAAKAYDLQAVELYGAYAETNGLLE